MCAPCGRPPGEVYQANAGGTMSDAMIAPSRAPARARITVVFMVYSFVRSSSESVARLTRRRVHERRLTIRWKRQRCGRRVILPVVCTGGGRAGLLLLARHLFAGRL